MWENDWWDTQQIERHKASIWEQEGLDQPQLHVCFYIQPFHFVSELKDKRNDEEYQIETKE